MPSTLKHRYKDYRLAALAALAAVVLLADSGLAAPAAHAQDRRLEDVLNKLERLERDMRVINRQLYRRAPGAGARPPAPGAAAPRPAPATRAAPRPADGVRLENAYAARLEARLADLESEIRSATGSIENFNHSLTQVSSRLDKLVADMELRLSDMEKRLLQASVRAPAAPQPGARPGYQPQPRQQITGVARPPAVREAGPATGGPSFARPAQSLGSISPNDLAGLKRGESPPAPTILPKGSAEDRYKFAKDLVHRAEYEKAALAFQEFIATHPGDTLISNARYWLGKTYYVRREYRDAAEAFLQSFRGDPKGNKAADNLLSLGMSLSHMDKKTDACTMFDKLTSDFPDAPNRITRLLKRERSSADCG